MNMTALTFTLKKNPAFKVDCSQLTPDKLTAISLDKILEITLTNNVKVIDLFKVSGDNIEQIIFKKSTSQLDFIGHKMLRGNITIDGDCGDFLGANMRNGSIICHGNAGDRVGDQMRRGLILIDGNAGDYCGSRMIAGTIGAFEKVGKYAGFSMKRGTILLTQNPTLHATIQDCGAHTLPFLALLLSSFKPFLTKFNAIKTNRVQRYAGDLACDGKGEVLVFLT
jgi:formylmethanofuran dehydrogenase subunit C